MVATQGPGWRLAPALAALIGEVDRRSPNRSTASDGSIGDAAHASRESHHNPWEGYVDALDVTNDPLHGVDAWLLANALKDDPRLEYTVAFNPLRAHDVIYSAARADEGWRLNGTGTAHRSHVHWSLRREMSARLDVRPWLTAPVVHEEDEMPRFLPVRRPKAKAGPSQAAGGRIAGYTIDGTKILGVHGAALAGDRARDRTDRIEPGRTEVRELQTRSDRPLIDLFYWINDDGEEELDKIGAYNGDRFHGTFGPFRCT